MHLGIGKASHGGQGAAHAKVCFGKARLAGHSLPEADDRFGIPADLKISVAQVAMGLGKIRLEAHGLLDERHARLGLAGLTGKHAQQVQGIDVARVRRQHLAIELVRLAQPPRLMILHRRNEGLVDRRHGSSSATVGGAYDVYCFSSTSLEPSRSLMRRFSSDR